MAHFGGQLPRAVRRPGGLPFDHDAIVAHAVDVVRADYRQNPDPTGLLPEPFTLRQPQQVHEAVLGHLLAKDSFRHRRSRSSSPLGRLAPAASASRRVSSVVSQRTRGSGAALPAGKSP